MGTRVAVVGANGRMGQLATRLIEQSDDLEVAAAIGSSDSLDSMAGADVVLDLTLPQSSQLVVDHAVSLAIPTVVGTSGWSSERIASLQRAVAAQPGLAVLIIPNFSVGSVLASSFAAQAARFFDSIEIVEAHHAAKVDSPSGTAVRTAELIGEARSALGPVIAPHADQRARGQQVASVPIHSLRMQGVLAKQEVMLGGTGEVLTIAHETLSSSSYEAGILLALRSASAAEGVVVGLDALLGL
jgi:4-hydroxy-tetrahydrodipicolinate reductase